MSLTVVKPLALTDARLTATDVPETDYPDWASGTTYALGARVTLTSTHKVYESLQASNTNRSPASEPTWWAEVSATNRWKAFDLSNSTRTAKAGSFYYEITPGVAITSVAVLNIANAQSVRIRLTDPLFGLVYDKTATLQSVPAYSTWYDWWFGIRTEEEQHVALDIPSFPNAVLRVDLVGGDSLAVGVILFGQQQTIADNVRRGVSLSIRDYSRKETNEWGDTVLVQRAYAKLRTFPVVIRNDELDRVDSILADLRATPALWVASSRHSALTVYGWYSNFEILVGYANYSDCSIDIEGLT